MTNYMRSTLRSARPGRFQCCSLIALCIGLLAGCGGTSKSNSTSQPGASAPAITTQPASQTVNLGQTASFSVVAAGSTPLSYQWKKSGNTISGATSSTYITPATTAADNGSTFLVVVTNSAGSVTSSSATLTVGSGSTPPPSSSSDVTTYHNDNARTGQNLTETTLTQSNVNSQTFGLLRNLMVDGHVDAEPLYLSHLTVAGAPHNVVFIETENDSAYAFDSDTGAQLWHASLLGSGESPSDDHGCSQISPQIGVTSTPVIDRQAGTNGTIFMVAMSKTNSTYIQRLHALDVTTGAELLGGPMTIQATYPSNGPNSSAGQLTFKPTQYAERAGLLLLNGAIYTSWTSHCDSSPYNGWIIGYSESNLSQIAVLNLTPNGNEGSIWQSGGGLAADSQGNIYALMANGTFDPTLDSNGFPSGGDYGNAFVKVSTGGGALKVVDYFNMFNTVNESNQDGDLGSGGIMLLPDVTSGSGTVSLAVGAGKDSNLYVVNRSNMGKFNPSSNSIYQELQGALPNGVWAVPAYFNGTVYYCSVGQNLYAFNIVNGMLSGNPVKSSGFFLYPGLLPSVSANGSANGIVWAIENASDGSAVLHAWAANNVAQELYNSNQAASGRDHYGADEKFITPMIADGKVFAATTNSVAVFGLLQNSVTQLLHIRAH